MVRRWKGGKDAQGRREISRKETQWEEVRVSLDQGLGRRGKIDWGPGRDVKVDVNDVLRRGRVSDRSASGESRP